MADEHVAHSGVSVVAGAGMTGGGTIDSTVTLNVIGNNGVTVAADVLGLTDVTKGAEQPLSLLSGTWDFDITALSAATASASLAGTESIILDEGGTNKKVAIQDLGMRVQLAQATQTVAAADMNTIMEFTATATLTLPLNSGTALPIGVPIVLNMKHATQELTVTAAASVTLVSLFHPGGTAAASDTVNAGGTALLYKTAADVWCLSGDIST